MEKKILEQVTKEFNLPKKKIKQIYNDWLAYIAESIRDMDLTEYTNQLGFTIPSVGKIYVDKNKLKHINIAKRNGSTKVKEDSGKKQ